MDLHIYSRNLVGLGLLIIMCSRLYSFIRAPDEALDTSTLPNQESAYFGNLWLSLGGLHNLAREKGSPYEFSNSGGWGVGLGLGNKCGPFWWKLSGGGFGNLGSDTRLDTTVNGQSEMFQSNVGLLWVGVDVCYSISTAKGRFKIGPSVGCQLIYEEALVYPPSHERIVWSISELYLGPAFGIQTKYDINENWRIVASLMHYNTTSIFHRATTMILFPEPFFGDKFSPNVLSTGCGIDLWLKDGRYKSISFFFAVAAF